MTDDELKKLREKYGPSYGWTSGAAEDRAEVCRIIDELTETRRELKPYENARLLPESKVVARLKADLVRSHEALANARAVMAEEAARWVDKRAAHISSGFEGAVADADEHRAWTAAKIRALAPLNPSLLVVEREVVEAVKEALRLAAVSLPHLDNRSVDKVVSACSAALTRLEGKP